MPTTSPTRSEAMETRRLEIWLAPLDPLVRQFNGTQGSEDYFDLFKPGAGWPRTAERIKVFKIYPQLIEQGSEADLINMFRALESRHIRLALEFGAMTDTSLCGRGIEGYDGEALTDMGKRIARLGGRLKYLAMDEPLWYGAHYSGKNSCHAKIRVIAEDVAANIRNLRAIDPDLQVGDIEPIPQTQAVDWAAELNQWSAEFERATGRQLAFFHADVIWNQPWEAFLGRLTKSLSGRKIPLGIIINGNGDETSDQLWTTHVMEHCERIRAGLSHTQQLVFQTWTNYPSRVLPETAPWTMTGVFQSCLNRL